MLASLPSSVADLVRIWVAQLNEANRRVIAVAACRGIDSQAAADEPSALGMTDCFANLRKFCAMAAQNGIDGAECIAEAAADHAHCIDHLAARWSARR